MQKKYDLYTRELIPYINASFTLLTYIRSKYFSYKYKKATFFICVLASLYFISSIIEQNYVKKKKILFAHPKIRFWFTHISRKTEKKLRQGMHFSLV